MLMVCESIDVYDRKTINKKVTGKYDVGYSLENFSKSGVLIQPSRSLFSSRETED